jgi:hypothetical protein
LLTFCAVVAHLHLIMPADSQTDTHSSSQSYHFLVGLGAGIFSFAALSLVFPRIGVEPMETVIFAALSGLTVGVFVCRERILVYKLALSERKHAAQLSAEAERINELYSNSVASLVTFDAGTLMIDRVSSGFFDLLGISANKDLDGGALDEVLGVDSTHLASVVYKIKVGTISVREELVCKQSDGRPVTLLISGRYMPELHLVEAAFYRVPQRASKLADYERVMDDLERFKQGIVRRENRVLELKGEVNQLLQQARQSQRYQVDSMTDDSHFVQNALNTKKAMEHE